MACSNCKTNKPIVNKKYNLCGDCVFEKNHGGQTRAQVYGARLAAKRETEEPSPKYWVSKKKPKRIKQQTKKEEGIKSALLTLKTEIDMDNVLDGTYYCRGCGKSYVGLDKSHILSVKQRKDLELLKSNMQLMCRTCHMAWESWNVVQMGKLICFEENMQFIFLQDRETFQKIMTKIDDYLLWEPAENQLVITLKKVRKNFENCC